MAWRGVAWAGKKNGVRHTRGQKLRTWEVIRENALHSYKIMKNKNYRVRNPPTRSSVEALALTHMRVGLLFVACPRSEHWPL